MENSNLFPAMDFGDALISLEDSDKVYREGWNGQGMYLVFYDNRPPSLFGAPFIVLWTGKTFVPWCPSQTDILAKDWRVRTDA